MSTPEKGYNINQTFIIETNEDGGVLSACTALFTTNIYSCSGNTQILMGNTSINMVGDVFVNGDLSATTISATTYYGDGSNLTGITTKDTFVTGGTYNNGTAVFKNNTGGTFSVSGFSTGYTLTSSAITSTLGYVPLSSYTDTFVTGGTYSNEIIIFTNNTGGTFSVSGFSTSNTTEFTGGSVSGKTVFTNGLTANTISATTYQNLPLDIHVTGFSFNNGNYNITINQNDGTSYTQNLSILATDVNITGGTYNPVTGVATFINNTGGTFNVSGFLTGYTDTTISAFTYNNANTFKIDSNNGDSFSATIDYVTGLTANTLSATTYLGLPLDIRVTGATYSNNTFTFSNNTGGTFNVLFNTVSGLTATTISATTYQNLPTDVRVTGGTYSNGTAIFTNNTGGTFSVSGFSTGSGSGSDIFVTGATYNNANQFTFTNNTGGTFNVSFNTVSGLTANTISATTYQNLPTDVFVTGGTYSSGTAIFTNNTGGTFSVSGFSSSSSNSSFTGGTVSGSTNFTNGLSATTISATTYQNLPIDIRVTGGTYSNGTATFRNNTGGTFSVSGFSTGSSSSIVVGSTVISSGTTGRIPFNNSSVYGESANLFWDNTNGRLGLGGIAPNYNFSIMRNAPNTFVGMQISNNSSGTANSDGLLIGIGSDNNARVETQDANSIIISSNSTGKLQVGTTGTQFFGTLTNTSPNTGAIFQINGNSSTSGLGFFQLRNNGGTPVLCANENGKVSINLGSVGTAQFHIGAGSMAANTAPIKINSGPLMATPESGTIEYNNTFHVTNSDSTRRHIVTAPNTTKVTAGAPYTNDGYIIVNIGGTDFKLMTTA